MRNNYFIFGLSLIILLLLSGCGSDGTLSSNTTIEEDQMELHRLAAEIENIIGGAQCDDPNNCRVIGFGAKPCGGVLTYLAYSIDRTNTILLKQKVDLYNKKNAAFNIKWGIASDCSIAPYPKDLTCEDGHCVAVY